MGVEPEPEHLHHVDHHEQPGHESVFLLPTTIPRALAAAGWLGGAVATVVLLVALLPDFRDGRTADYRVDLGDARAFAAMLIAAGLVFYVGWAWWSISAAFNANRLAPMSTSPWLPTLVYCGGPIIMLAGADRSDSMSTPLLLAGSAWIALGHLTVVASMRSTAGRIRASTDEFAKLFWLPIAWVTYRMFANTMLTFVDDQWRSTWLLLGIGGLSALFPLALAAATWHAAGTFDHACRRLNAGGAPVELATTDVITAALRRRALEGR